MRFSAHRRIPLTSHFFSLHWYMYFTKGFGNDITKLW